MYSIFDHQKKIEEYLIKKIKINEREAKIEASHILKFVLKKPNSFLISNQKEKLNKIEDEFVSKILKKRSKNEPLAYIFKEWDFYGETFYLNRNSLIPRQDTELMIDLVINQYDKNSKLNILDLGTGSGIIGITLSKIFTNSKITITDISLKALQVANKNIKKHKVKNIKSLESNWFDKINKDEKFDLIVTNPPYISINDKNLDNPELKYEPKSALVALDEGYYDIFKIIDKSHNFLKPKGMLFIEHGNDQSVRIKKYIQKKSYCSIRQFKDINHKVRVTSATKIKF